MLSSPSMSSSPSPVHVTLAVKPVGEVTTFCSATVCVLTGAMLRLSSAPATWRVHVSVSVAPSLPDEGPLRAAHADAVRAANALLPPRQREALALRELEELSYDQVAVVMGMNRNSVAQLISRARLNLRDGLRRGALVSIPAASADCEAALPLLTLAQGR